MWNIFQIMNNSETIRKNSAAALYELDVVKVSNMF